MGRGSVILFPPLSRTYLSTFDRQGEGRPQCSSIAVYVAADFHCDLRDSGLQVTSVVTVNNGKPHVPRCSPQKRASHVPIMRRSESIPKKSFNFRHINCILKGQMRGVESEQSVPNKAWNMFHHTLVTVLFAAL